MLHRFSKYRLKYLLFVVEICDYRPHVACIHIRLCLYIYGEREATYEILYTYDTSINQRFLSMLLISGLLLYAHPYIYTHFLFSTYEYNVWREGVCIEGDCLMYASLLWLWEHGRNFGMIVWMGDLFNPHHCRTHMHNIHYFRCIIHTSLYI